MSTFNVYDWDCTATIKHTFNSKRLERFADGVERTYEHQLRLAREQSEKNNIKPGFAKSAKQDVDTTGLINICTHHNHPHAIAANIHVALASQFGVDVEDVKVAIDRVVPHDTVDSVATSLYKARVRGVERTIAITHITKTYTDYPDSDAIRDILQYKNIQLAHHFEVLKSEGLISAADEMSYFDDLAVNCAKAVELDEVADAHIVVEGPDYDFICHEAVAASSSASVSGMTGGAYYDGGVASAVPAPAVASRCASDLAESMASQLPGSVVIGDDNNGYYVRPGQFGVLIRDKSVFDGLEYVGSPKLTVVQARERLHVKNQCQFASAGVLSRSDAEIFASRFPGRPVLRESSSQSGMMTVTYFGVPLGDPAKPAQFVHLEFKYTDLVSAGASDHVSIATYIEGLFAQPLVRPAELALSNHGVQLTDIRGVGAGDIEAILRTHPDGCVLRPSSRPGEVAMSYLDSGAVKSALIGLENISEATISVDAASGLQLLVGRPIVTPEQMRNTLFGQSAAGFSSSLFGGAVAPPAAATSNASVHYEGSSHTGAAAARASQ